MSENPRKPYTPATGYSLSLDGCGCCADHFDTEVTDRCLMPDGKILLRLSDRNSDRTWWYDEDLRVGWGRD